MKTKIIAVLMLFAFTVLGAQTVHNPNDELYKDIDRWFVQGYITDFIPMVRPYPAQLINKLLDQVINNGDASARETAAAYKAKIAPGTRFITPGILGHIQGNDEDYELIGAPFAEGLFQVNSVFNVSYNLTFFGLTDHEGGERFNVPGTYNIYPDLIDDTADIGPFRILQNWTSIATLGTSDMYFQAGLSRSSFGPFYDNGVVVGPQAPRAGHFSFVYSRPLWSMEMLFQTLSATDDWGNGRFSQKYNIIHALNFRPWNNLELGIVQSLVYGKRIDPLYFVPFTFMFGLQTVNGFEDNALIGLYFRGRLFNSLLVKGQIYIDDFSFNGLKDGNPFFKTAGIAGVSWAPRNSVLSKLDFDYTAVMPYMYTHWIEREYNVQPGEPNYLNYTHMGRNIGPELEPNSDRISLRTRWGIIRNLDINVSAYMIRHGNASADHSPNNHLDQDGSIFDHGTNYYGSGYNTNPHRTFNFLTQSVIETRLGGTLGIAYTLPSPLGTFRFISEYGIQQTRNRGFVRGENYIDHFWSVGGVWSW